MPSVSSPDRFQDRSVLILGLAREGVSLARYVAEHDGRVAVTDSQPAHALAERLRDVENVNVAAFPDGDHPELVTWADEFFVSPGVPETNPVYRAAVDRGLPVQSMTTLFFEVCPVPITGITGSSGKTTTTGLTGHILSTAGLDVAVGGNIGDPMLDLLPRIRAETNVVLELSSFQLALLQRSPHMAAVTNISPNHLDRHGTMENYVNAKLNIARHQGQNDVLVLNAADRYAQRFAQQSPAKLCRFGDDPTIKLGAAQRGRDVGLIVDGAWERVMSIEEIPLLGRHNVENVLAAACLAHLAGVCPSAIREGVRTFQPARHRLQVVAEHDGVLYIDDSIATSPARAVVALNAVTRPIVLIAGGRDKRLPWDEFATVVAQRARGLVLVGEASARIAEEVGKRLGEEETMLTADNLICVDSLDVAVREARRMARPGDAVLLAPACTSYDMFTDFEERGEAFSRGVEAVCAA